MIATFIYTGCRGMAVAWLVASSLPSRSSSIRPSSVYMHTGMYTRVREIVMYRVSCVKWYRRIGGDFTCEKEAKVWKEIFVSEARLTRESVSKIYATRGHSNAR